LKKNIYAKDLTLDGKCGIMYNVITDTNKERVKFMTNEVITSVARVGNSNATIIPKEFLRLLHLEPKDKIKVTLTDDGLYIKPLPKWTQESQAKGVEKFLKSILETPDEEIQLDDFDNEFKFQGRKFKPEMFE
jgi:antitoxin component of MazEF toxin-antitoxin module